MEHRQFKLAALALAGLLAAAPLAADKEAGSTDVQDSMEDLRASLGQLSNQVNSMQAANDKAVVWGINTDIRMDDAPYTLPKADLGGTLAHPYTQGIVGLTSIAPNGYIGMYAKRVELEATGKISGWAVWNLQFEFAGLKLEDLGVDAKDMDLLPFVKVPGYGWEAKVGLYRQPFGVENQTGSSSIPFPERALIDGGYSPVDFTTLLGGTAVTKLVYERVMGVQLIQAHSYGVVGYKVQVAVADGVKDQDPGNPGAAATTSAFGKDGAGNALTSPNSLGLTTDQDPSEFGRLGVDVSFMPKIVTLNVGASAIHNSQNKVLLANTGANEVWQDTYGLDATVAVPPIQTTFQGEWVAQNNFNNGTVGIPGKLISRGEGWYLESTTKPLGFFDMSNLDLNLRLEQVMPNVNLAGTAPSFIATKLNAATIGLKFLYAGKNYTSVNYTSYALNGDYSAIAGSSMFNIQQQFNF